MTRKVKKVRFRPGNLSVETDNNVTSRENVDGQGRVMRSRWSKLSEGHVNGTKRGIMFHSMERRELMALCRKHNIPANLSNLEMAKRLAEFFKEKEKPPIQGPMNVFDEIANETDSTNMVMDFHSMKRKDLQALCQKHNIPANLSNLEMSKRLSEFFKENDKSSIQGLINEQDKNAAMTRKVKKVRFSPEYEVFEFTRTPELKRKSGRNSVSVRPRNLSVETVDNSITSRENVDGQGRVMRSRGSKLTEGRVNETKREIMFHSMKRRELLALCQKHNIPGNLPNLEIAKRLSEFFKEKEKPPIQGPMNVFDEIANETDFTNMVMDFHSMKRKDLQALCKKQNIPTNLSNLEMTKRLSEFSKENEKPSIQELINEQDENVAMTRKVKKVRFSPEHELFEFTRSPDLKRKSRRNSVSVRPVDRARQRVGPVGRPKRIVKKPARLL